MNAFIQHSKTQRMFAAVLVVFAVALFLFSSEALAQGGVCDVQGAGGSSFCQNQDTSGGNATNNRVTQILNTVVTVMTTIAGVIATITIIISGIMFTTAGADAQRAAKARSALIYSVVAVIVAIMARLIIVFVLGNI